jgi:myo-inositol-1(or 4)-monophosphatase
MLTPDPHYALPIAQRAMDLAIAHVQRHQPTRLTAKGDRDLVIDVDEGVEHLLRDVVHHWVPGIGSLVKSTAPPADQVTYCVLDPIGGTINFSHGGPLCAIALVLVHDNLPVHGVTALRFLGRRYWAATGSGAYRDGHRVVATIQHLNGALIGLCDYGSGPDAQIRDRLCAAIDQHLTQRAQGVGRVGTTALDLVWVADGTFDAAVLLGSPHTTRSRCALTANPALAEVLVPMLSIARTHRTGHPQSQPEDDLVDQCRPTRRRTPAGAKSGHGCGNQPERPPDRTRSPHGRTAHRAARRGVIRVSQPVTGSSRWCGQRRGAARACQRAVNRTRPLPLS